MIKEKPYNEITLNITGLDNATFKAQLKKSLKEAEVWDKNKMFLDLTILPTYPK